MERTEHAVRRGMGVFLWKHIRIGYANVSQLPANLDVDRSWRQDFQGTSICFGVYEYRRGTWRAGRHPRDVRFSSNRGGGSS